MQTQKTLLNRFFEMADKYPQGIAIKQSEKSMSYLELKRWVIAIAGALRECKVCVGDYVAVEVTPSAELIATLLAVQAVGAAYVPLDKKAPIERNQRIISDAKPVMIIGDMDSPNHKGYRCENIYTLLEISTDVSFYDASSLQNVAYIIYTSGTTGKPKGVPITHGNLQALFAVTENFYNFNEKDVVLLYHSYAFDFSVWEIWSVLGYGGKLVIPDEQTKVIPERLAWLIKEEGITLLNQTPTAFSVNADKLCQFKHGELSLRFIIFGGERLNFQTLKKWHKHFGLSSPLLVNMYGITETTVHASWHVINERDLTESVSNIGNVLSGFDYIVRPLSDDSQNNNSGELLLSGSQVTNGYLSNDDNGKFIWLENNGLSRRYYCSGDVVKHNHIGELIYLGRCDQQVKINGYRIEIGEIESVLAQQEDVIDISVIAAHSPMHGHHLICFYTTSVTSERVTEQLRSLAKVALPVYMRPMRYRKIDIMPKTVNGKIDKKSIMHSME